MLRILADLYIIPAFPKKSSKISLFSAQGAKQRGFGQDPQQKRPQDAAGQRFIDSYPRFSRLAYRYLGREADAQDAVQEELEQD